MQAADHNNEMKIGVRIRALRKARGITLTEMAEKTELSTGYLSKLENDQTSPTLVHLQKLCTAMDITLNDILSPEEPSGGNLPVVRKDIYSDQQETQLLQRGMPRGQPDRLSKAV